MLQFCTTLGKFCSMLCISVVSSIKVLIFTGNIRINSLEVISQQQPSVNLTPTSVVSSVQITAEKFTKHNNWCPTFPSGHVSIVSEHRILTCSGPKLVEIICQLEQFNFIFLLLRNLIIILKLSAGTGLENITACWHRLALTAVFWYVGGNLFNN